MSHPFALFLINLNKLFFFFFFLSERMTLLPLAERKMMMVKIKPTWARLNLFTKVIPLASKLGRPRKEKIPQKERSLGLSH